MQFSLPMTNIQVVRTRHLIKFICGSYTIYEYIPSDLDQTKLNSIVPCYIDDVQKLYPNMTKEIFERLLLESLKLRQAEETYDAKVDAQELHTIVRFFNHGDGPQISVAGIIQPTFAGITSSVYLRQDWSIKLPTKFILREDSLKCEMSFDIEDGDILFVNGYPVGQIQWCPHMNGYFLNRNEPKTSTLDKWENQTGLMSIY